MCVLIWSFSSTWNVSLGLFNAYMNTEHWAFANVARKIVQILKTTSFLHTDSFKVSFMYHVFFMSIWLFLLFVCIEIPTGGKNQISRFDTKEMFFSSECLLRKLSSRKNEATACSFTYIANIQNEMNERELEKMQNSWINRILDYQKNLSVACRMWIVLTSPSTVVARLHQFI